MPTDRVLKRKHSACKSTIVEVMETLEILDECKAGHYTTNEVVAHCGLVCQGGLGQPACNFLEICLEAHKLRV